MTDSACVGLIGIPFDANSSFLNGPRLAPIKIREQLCSDHWNMTTENGVDLDKTAWQDFGDIKFVGIDSHTAFTTIKKSVSNLIRQDVSLVSLGGDHSVSYPVIMAHLEKYPDLNVLHIDAHSDLYDDFEGNPFSHASPFARLMESGHIGRLVQVGIRTLNAHQRQQADKFGVEIIQMKDFGENLSLVFEGPVYITFDLDALDPAYAPGVSHHEPGGLTTRQAINLIHKIQGKVIGADVVELNPVRDSNSLTATVAAKLVKEIFGRIIQDSDKPQDTCIGHSDLQ